MSELGGEDLFANRVTPSCASQQGVQTCQGATGQGVSTSRTDTTTWRLCLKWQTAGRSMVRNANQGGIVWWLLREAELTMKRCNGVYATILLPAAACGLPAHDAHRTGRKLGDVPLHGLLPRAAALNR